ncbi:unnamed protein product [Boreogadus saida]
MGVCSLEGDPVLNGNVTLGCQSSQGKPEPQYKWTKAAPTSEIFFSPMQNCRDRDDDSALKKPADPALPPAL